MAAKGGLVAQGGSALGSFWRRVIALTTHAVIGGLLGVGAVVLLTTFYQPVAAPVGYLADLLETAARVSPRLTVGALLGVLLGLGWLATRRS